MHRLLFASQYSPLWTEHLRHQGFRNTLLDWRIFLLGYSRIKEDGKHILENLQEGSFLRFMWLRSWLELIRASGKRMSDVPVWILGLFPDTRPQRPTQVSTVINLHRSKLPCIPNEGRQRCVWCAGEKKSGKQRTKRRGSKEPESSGVVGRRRKPRIDEDSDGSWQGREKNRWTREVRPKPLGNESPA